MRGWNVATEAVGIRRDVAMEAVALGWNVATEAVGIRWDVAMEAVVLGCGVAAENILHGWGTAICCRDTFFPKMVSAHEHGRREGRTLFLKRNVRNGHPRPKSGFRKT